MKYFSKLILIILTWGMISISYAQPQSCVLVLTKSQAWNDYDVTIKMYNFVDQKIIASFNLSKPSADNVLGVSTLRAPFDCNKYPKVTFTATFSPQIWQDQKNHEYPSTVVWDLAQQIQQQTPNNAELIIPISFPDQFVGIPDLSNSIDPAPKLE